MFCPTFFHSFFKRTKDFPHIVQSGAIVPTVAPGTSIFWSHHMGEGWETLYCNTYDVLIFDNMVYKPLPNWPNQKIAFQKVGQPIRIPKYPIALPPIYYFAHAVNLHLNQINSFLIFIGNLLQLTHGSKSRSIFPGSIDMSCILPRS